MTPAEKVALQIGQLVLQVLSLESKIEALEAVKAPEVAVVSS